MVKQSAAFHRHIIFLLVLSLGLSLFTAYNQHMNNFLIFRSSFWHLWEGTNLYSPYPAEHHDIFKYSPTFAMFMGLFAWLPKELGAALWNLLGAILLALALVNLPVKPQVRNAVFWISLPEFIGSTQGFQSNIHVASLLVLFWICLERKKAITAAICILATFFIKIFGIVGLVLLFYSKYSTRNFRFLFKFKIAFVFTAFILIFSPVLITGWHGLQIQYLQWLAMLRNDAASSYGFSLMGIVYAFVQQDFPVFYFQVVGGLLLTGTILWGLDGDKNIRLLGLIAVTYFFVVFNHKSESPTFIIPMIGFGLHQSLIKSQKIRWSLIVFTLFMVSVMYSDLVPKDFKHNIANFYAFKAWPFVILLPMALAGISSGRGRVLAAKTIRRTTY